MLSRKLMRKQRALDTMVLDKKHSTRNPFTVQ
jgi:hypothetical protein